MTKKLYVSKVIAVLFCILTMFSFSVANTSAATSGGSRSTTINVSTKAAYWYPGSSSITLTQSKQTATLKRSGKKDKKTTGYFGSYDIIVYNKTKKTTEYKSWDGGKTKKINLKPNCEYTITVNYNPTKVQAYELPRSYKGSDLSSPSWWVSSKWKISSCW